MIFLHWLGGVLLAECNIRAKQYSSALLLPFAVAVPLWSATQTDFRDIGLSRNGSSKGTPHAHFQGCSKCIIFHLFLLDA